MYKNVGKKIKHLAKTSCIVESIAAIILGICLIAVGISDSDYWWHIPFGWLVLYAGPVIAWVSSWLLYGYGELIDKACDIEKNTRSSDESEKAPAKNPPKAEKTKEEQKAMKEEAAKRKQLAKLRSQGLISEDEYQNAISKMC